MILFRIHLLVDCKQGNLQENTKTQTLLTCQTLVLRDKNVFLDALVYTMAREESGNTRPCCQGRGDRGTQAGQPGDQPDRRLTHWQVCAGWLEPGQHLRKPIIVPCLVPSQSVSHNVTESLHYGHPDPVLFSLVFSLQTL